MVEFYATTLIILENYENTHNQKTKKQVLSKTRHKRERMWTNFKRTEFKKH